MGHEQQLRQRVVLPMHSGPHPPPPSPWQVNLKGTLLPLPRSAHGRPTVSDLLKDYEAAVAKEVPEGEQQDPQV